MKRHGESLLPPHWTLTPHPITGAREHLISPLDVAASEVVRVRLVAVGSGVDQIQQFVAAAKWIHSDATWEFEIARLFSQVVCNAGLERL